MPDQMIFFNNQNYYSIRSELQNQSLLFFDETFPADDVSISPTGKMDNIGFIEWKRPSEIDENSCLFREGISIHDVCQGNLGNCWLISALAELALHPECLQKVIPHINDQEWYNTNRATNKYTGMFRFCFWRFGEWVEVVIDDRLPCRNGNLIFAHSKDKKEFWAALIEKAYAKINGSYEALIGGLTCESLVDFTGGIPEQVNWLILRQILTIDQLFDIKKYTKDKVELENLFKLLQFDFKDGSLICASIASRSDVMEEKLANGLITTHAYSITGVCKLDIRSSRLRGKYKEDYLMCLKIRNPWGLKEWTGALSDQSEEWNSISLKEKASMGWKIDNDGEFWIILVDFLNNFNQITIVRLIKTGIFKYNSNWYGSSGKSYWTDVAGDRKSALSEVGGGGQFRINIVKPMGDIFLLHLLQKCKRGNEIPLGVVIAEVERNRTFMVHSQDFCSVKLEYRLGGSRSICLRYRLAFGTYIIKPFLTIAVPTAKYPVYYLLRCYTTKPNNGAFLPMELDVPKSNCFCQSKYPCIISRLNIIQAELIVTPEELDVKNIFCEVTCENQIFKTKLNTNPTELIWDESFLLYRKDVHLPVVIKIFHQERVLNSLIGYVLCMYDPSKVNGPGVVESINPIFEPKKRSLCTKIKNLKLSWYNTDSKGKL